MQRREKALTIGLHSGFDKTHEYVSHLWVASLDIAQQDLYTFDA
jgi:hypothetical protein